jgi:protein-tyrosine-phosphatase
MPLVLFVCTGNICRSPIGQALLRRRLKREGLSDWEVESAGTWTVDGASASAHAIQLMAEQGVDLAAHRSRGVDEGILERADLILVMTRSHIEALRLEFPDQARKIYMLSEMVDGHRYDIKDPYGGSLTDYEVCVRVLSKLIEEGFERIKSLAESNARDKRDPQSRPDVG